MAAFLNNCRFIPTAGTTTDWVYASTVGGCQSPALAGAIDGRKYKFIAISTDLTQWEIAEGAYTAASGTFARTTVLYNSSGSGTAAGQSGAGSKISFAAAPNVAIVGVKEDLISIEEANAFTAAQMAQARANIGLMKRNYLINGGMMVSQENGATASSTTGYYPVDQWSYNSGLTTGVISAGQVASLTPGGSANRIRATVTTAQASAGTDIAYLEQRLEGVRVGDLLWGNAGAKTVTLQVGVRSPVSGTFEVQVVNNTFASQVLGSFTIAAGEVNTDVVKSVTLTGVTTGTWTPDNIGRMYVRIFMVWGGVQTANLCATNGNVLELFDVGLYEGTTAPAFQLPDLISELAACRRYWRSSYVQGTQPGSATNTAAIRHFPEGSTTFANMGHILFDPPMRATPTVTLYAPGSGTAGKIRNMDAGTDLPGAIADPEPTGFFAFVNSSSVTTATTLGFHFKADARM